MLSTKKAFQIGNMGEPDAQPPTSHLKFLPYAKILRRNKIMYTLHAKLLTLLCVCSILLFSCQSTGNIPHAADMAEIPFDTAITHGTLENGLVYYIVENSKPENRAELRLVVNAGSILEDDDQQGSLIFLSTWPLTVPNCIPENDLISFLQNAGINLVPILMRIQALMKQYTCSLYQQTAVIRLEQGFEILEHWAFSHNTQEQDVISERNVILEEWRIGRGRPAADFTENSPRTFEGSLYAERLPIGKPEIIETADPETLRRFMKIGIVLISWQLLQ